MPSTMNGKTLLLSQRWQRPPILDDVTRRKEMLEIELQCSNYYLDMSDGVQHPVPKPDYTEKPPESFLSSLLKKKED